MAKKFVWNDILNGDVGTLVTKKDRERITKQRYSDLDMMYFAGLMLESAGINVDTLDYEAITESAKESYEILASVIASGEYDEAINEDFPVMTNA